MTKRLLTLCASLCLCLALPAGAAPSADEPAVQDEAGISLDDIRAFTAVYSLIKQAYVEEVDDHELMQAAIRGLLAGLDAHSAYLEPAQMDATAEDVSGKYVGLGVEVMQADGQLHVIAPIDDTPAQRAGLRPGDVIVRIDGKPVQADDLDGAIDKLRGPAGTTVRLTLFREGAAEPLEVELVREVITVASVRARWLEPGLAYLRISQFQMDTGRELAQRTQQMMAAADVPLRGAILDLRSNPGGLLDAAVEVSDLLLDGGGIVSTRGRVSELDMSFSAHPGDLLEGKPLVVLVDRGTASASEIVAGALKDNHRGVLMGQRTFGKGSVQTVLPLDDGHAVKLTTARYYTPAGTSIQAQGIEPDIELADLQLSARVTSGVDLLSERDLARHLDNESAEQQVAAKPDEQLQRDYALGEALNLLKGLTLRSR